MKGARDGGNRVCEMTGLFVGAAAMAGMIYTRLRSESHPCNHGINLGVGIKSNICLNSLGGLLSTTSKEKPQRTTPFPCLFVS